MNTNKKIKKEAKKQVKKAYKRVRASKYFPLIVGILILAFAIYILIPEKETKPTVPEIENGVIHYELPKSNYDEEIIRHKAYTLGYNENTEQPNWVAYTISKDNLLKPVTERDGEFREDYSVTTLSASLDDYRSSGYDRGHLAPAADFKWDKEAMNESFYLSNMSPQDPEFNRGIWADLESAVRNNAYDSDFLYVTTGPVFYKNKPIKTIGKNKVAVPHAYYKALLVYTDDEKKAIGFLLPNEGSDKPLASYTMSIDELEDITGLDFFYLLDDDIENELEKKYNPRKWTYSKFYGPSVDEANNTAEVYEKPKSSNNTIKFRATAFALKRIKRQIRQALHLNK